MQVISKARDFEAGLNTTESAITKHQLEEMVHKVASDVSKTSHRSNRRQPHAQPGLLPPSTGQWCGKAIRIQLGGTVLQQMPFAIVVAKGATQ